MPSTSVPRLLKTLTSVRTTSHAGQGDYATCLSIHGMLPLPSVITNHHDLPHEPRPSSHAPSHQRYTQWSFISSSALHSSSTHPSALLRADTAQRVGKLA
ncbi:hypothetical protein DL546_004941 [Coniochaeta pulveracea]|uniref:Uncharacterized protein n=1 Tax=Coniochaeta pulveracea TaxID=177199 RepID=A0A420Y9L2_9PEZI|nr:hypothetical protein DL546_004941 [Coniochaeta pulveracea]